MQKVLRICLISLLAAGVLHFGGCCSDRNVSGSSGGDDGDATSETGTSDPATLENLDGGFFACNGRRTGADTCSRFLFSELKRSFFYFKRDGGRCKVYDDDVTFMGDLSGETMELADDFTAYKSFLISVEGMGQQIVFCRVQVTDAQYELVFGSKDAFTVSGEGTLQGDSAGVPSCEGIMQYYLPASCRHVFEMTCRRLQGGLSEAEIATYQEEKQEAWEHPPAFSSWSTDPADLSQIVARVDLSNVSVPAGVTLWFEAATCPDFQTNCNWFREGTVIGTNPVTVRVIVPTPGTYYLTVFADVDADHWRDPTEPGGALTQTGSIQPLAVSVTKDCTLANACTVNPSPDLITLYTAPY